MHATQAINNYTYKCAYDERSMIPFITFNGKRNNKKMLTFHLTRNQAFNNKRKGKYIEILDDLSCIRANWS